MPYKAPLWYIQHRSGANAALDDAKTGLCVSNAMRLAAAHSNVYVDTSSYLVPFMKLRRMCAKIGAEKLIFGSDAPVMSDDPSEGLERVRRLHIPEEAKARILGGNLGDVLGLK